MKKDFFISFSVPFSDGDRFRDFVQNMGCASSWQEPFNERGRPSLYHTFAENDPRLTALRELLSKEGIEWSEREEHSYTDAELRSFPLLTIGIDREPIEGGGPEDGTLFDLSRGCPRCGTGAVQTSALMITLSGRSKKGLTCSTALGDILAAEPLTLALQDANITGLELRQAHSCRNDKPLPWWQMISDYCMPEMSPATRGIVFSETDHVVRPDFIIRAEPPCPDCRRDGRFGTPDKPLEIIYSSRDVDADNLPDVVHTWECFGKSIRYPLEGRDPRYRVPSLLIKPKVFDIFRHLKDRHATFGPVHFED